LAYVGICEQIYPDLVFPSYIVNFKHVGRSVGPSLEPVGYGIGLLFCLLFSIYLFSKISNSLSAKRTLAFITILIAPIAIFFTYTRGVWGGLISSLVVLVLFYPRGKKILGSLLLILVIGFMLIQTMQVSKIEGSAKEVVHRDTIDFHIFMPITGIQMFLEKPIFGFGQFQFKNKYLAYMKAPGDYELPDEGFVVHNTFINILVELGLIGFIPFFFILFYLIRDAINLYRTSVESRDIAIIFLAACAAFIAAGMVNNMQYKFAHVLLFSMAGMTKGLLQGKALSKGSSALTSKAAYT
jgi:O-antigen ligase